MEGEKKRISTSPPQDVDDLPAMFDPESSEWKTICSLLPVLKHVYEDPEKAPGEHEVLSDWLDISECVSCLIRFLSRCDLIEECDKLPCLINRLKEACESSSFDYTALIRYAEWIYADAAELCKRDGEEEDLLAQCKRNDKGEDSLAQTEIEFASLSLIKYKRELTEVNVSRTQEKETQLFVTLERSTRQVEELKRRIGLSEQLLQVLFEELHVLRREEAAAVKKLKETQGKFSDIPFYSYQEQRSELLSRANKLFLMEPGPAPLSLASQSESDTSD